MTQGPESLSIDEALAQLYSLPKDLSNISSHLRRLVEGAGEGAVRRSAPLGDAGSFFLADAGMARPGIGSDSDGMVTVTIQGDGSDVRVSIPPGVVRWNEVHDLERRLAQAIAEAFTAQHVDAIHR